MTRDDSEDPDRLALRVLVLFCGAVLVALFVASFARPSEPPFAVKIVTERTSPEGKPVKGSGSGTVIAHGGGKSAILTCKHVCPTNGEPVNILAGGKTVKARTYRTDQRADLAIVVADAELPACYLARVTPRPGEVLRQWGHPFGGILREKAGQWLGFRGRNELGGAPVCESTIAAEPGDSGAGIFSADGYLVGVCWGGDKTQSAVGVGEVWRFLRECRMVEP